MQNPATTRPQRPVIDPTQARPTMRPAMPVDSRLFGGWGVRF